MNILSLPLNARVGITRSTQDDCLQALDSGRCHENHLGTIHLSALFAVAEEQPVANSSIGLVERGRM